MSFGLPKVLARAQIPSPNFIISLPYALNQNLYYLEDLDSTFSLTDIQFGKFADRWNKLSRAVPNFGMSTHAHWLLAKVNFSRKFANPVFVISSPVLNQLDVFQVVDGALLRHDKLGVETKFSYLEYQHRYPIIPAVEIFDKDIEVYIRVRSTNSVQVPINIWELNDLFVRDQREIVIYSLYFGALIILAFYNLFLYVSTKIRIFLIYVGWIACLGLMMAALKGIGRQFLWGNWDWLNLVCVHLFVNLTVLFAMEFTREFLRLKDYLPFMNKVYQISEIITATSIIATLLLPLEYLATSVAALGVYSVLVGLSISIYLAIKGQPEAKIYLVAWSFFLAGALIFSLSKLGILAVTPYTEDGIMIGSYIELTLLSLALGYQIKKEAKEKSQLKSLMESERKRTKQIEKLHHELETNLTVAKGFQKENLPIQLCRENLTDFVMFWSPRDEVGGDYVWAKKVENKLLISLYDCTGHGVAAALRAMTVKANLDNLSLTREFQTSESLVRALDRELKQIKEADFSDDGLDILLLEVDLASWNIHFSGSKMSFYVVTNDSYESYKGTTRRIGANTRKSEKIASQNLTPEPGSFVYSLTDGLRDQKGPTSSPLGAKNGVRKLLSDLHKLPPEEQELKIAEKLSKFRGKTPQNDDATVVGFRIPERASLKNSA